MKKSLLGFTLIEMMVAVSIFTIVVLVGVGSLLSLVQANARAQAINSVMNNLNAAIETMSRSIRVGTSYHCGAGGVAITVPQSCPLGDVYLAFESAKGNQQDSTDQTVYRKNGTQLERSLNSGSTWVALTAPEVSIDTFTLYVIGACSQSGSGGTCTADSLQPRVLMLVKGSAKVPGGSTNFTVQASVVQRLVDI